MLPLDVLMDSSGPPPLLVLASEVALRSVGTDKSTRELLVLIVHPEDMLDPDSARAITGPLLELVWRYKRRSNRRWVNRLRKSGSGGRARYKIRCEAKASAMRIRGVHHSRRNLTADVESQTLDRQAQTDHPVRVE